MSIPSKRRRDLQNAASRAREAMDMADKLASPQMAFAAAEDSREYVEALTKEERQVYSKALNAGTK